MSHKSLLDEKVSAYVNEVVHPEPPVLASLRKRTRELREGGMQISPDQGRFLSLLVRMIGAKNAIEVGTFTGYSAICIASALPPDGLLVCCDVSEEWTDIAKQYWTDAGVSDRIKLKIAPGDQTLRGMQKQNASRFDFAFIDADKSGYDAYYELILPLLRPGGVMVLDNMLRGGRIANEDASVDADTRSLRTLTLKVRDDARVDSSLLTIGDGFLVIRKK